MTTLFSIAPRDLELEMEAISENGNHDLESVVMRFAHGECHALSCALHLTYGCPVIALVSQDDGDEYPVHSFVLLPNGLGLDAYGIHEPAFIANRYRALAGFNDMEQLIAIQWTSEKLTLERCMQEGDTPDDILNEFSVILQHLGLDLDVVYSESWTQTPLIDSALRQSNSLLNTPNTDALEVLPLPYC